MNRRSIIRQALGATGIFMLARVARPALAGEAMERVTAPDAEWRKRLTPEQYEVLRREGTEPPFTSPLNHETHKGTFECIACGLALFPSKFKFDSGTGWPSFYDVLPGHVEFKADFKLVLSRTEYHCARCGGHHGHVFKDGPAPTGLRYCNNGVALRFVADKA